MIIDATVIDRMVARCVHNTEWWDYIGSEVSDDQFRIMQMGRLAGISELATELIELLHEAEQTEPSDNSCKTCRYGEVDEGYVLCKYYSKDEQTEPQTDIHDFTDCDFCKDRNCKDCEGGKDEPQTDTEIAKAIVHKMIDDAVIAEDAYPDLRQKMHDAVDEYEPQTDCAWK